VRLETGQTHAFDALLLATGSSPVRLKLGGSAAIPIHYLRTFADSRAIVASATASKAKRALVIGASFIGLEVAASLRTRGLGVHVVAPEHEPLERVMGAEVGRFIRTLHEAKGVEFHLGTTVDRIDGQSATLADGASIDADFWSWV
jgi:NADPH-dependent 2,4-dienoyl-CoA reductase/sulfur reductase-like enzyme